MPHQQDQRRGAIARGSTTGPACEAGALPDGLQSAQRIAAALPDLVYIYDIDAQRATYANRSLSAWLGYADERHDVAQLVHPDDLAQIESHRTRLVAAPDGEVRELGWRVRHQSGEWRWLSSRETVFERTAEGRPRTILGTARDVTQPRKVENALRESEQLLASLYATMPIGICLTDEDGRFVQANDAYCRIFGYAREELLGRPFTINVPPEEVETAQTLYAQLMRGDMKARSERKRRRKDGQIIYISADYALLSRQDGQRLVITAVHNITERKQMELAMRISEARLARINGCLLSLGGDYEQNVNRLTALCGELLGASYALYNRLDAGLLCSFGQWNTPAGHQRRGRADGRICFDVIWRGQNDAVVVTDLQQSPYAASDVTVRAHGLQTYVGQAVKHQGETVGSLCAVFTQEVVPTEADLRALGILATAIGNEEARRRSEAALRESEQRNRELVESLQEGIWVIDADGFTTFVNPRLAEMLGYAANEVVGRPLLSFLSEPSREAWPRLVERCAVSSAVRQDCELLKKDGSQLFVMLSLHALRDEAGRYAGAIGGMTDLTARRQTEQELQQLTDELRRLTARLQSVREEEDSRIAQRIHDEVGQTLTALRMELAAFSAKLGPKRRELREHLRSMEDLISDLLATARRTALELRPRLLDELGLVAAMEWQAAEFVKRTGILCQVGAEPADVPLARPVATALYRIYQEALTNVARHAGAASVAAHLTLRSGLVELTIEDDGRGITEAAQAKPVCLGLVQMRERAIACGGTLEVSRCSEEGGTRIRVAVPLREGVVT